MRRLSATLAVSGLALALLTGCSSSSAGIACDTDAMASTPALDQISVSGDTADVPDVSIPPALPVTSTQRVDIVEGEGEQIVSPDQLVVFDMALFSSATGESLGSTQYDGSMTNVNQLSAWAQSIMALPDTLQCAREGARMLLGFTADDLSEPVLQTLGLTDDTGVIAVVDLRKVYLTKADGQDQFVSGWGMPSVVRQPDGRPGVIVPDTAPPSELRLQVLKAGDGEEVTAESTVRVHYTGLTWADKTVFDSSWASSTSEPAAFTLDQVVPGFAAALEGQRVGSQILAVIPPDQGYGDEGSGSIPGGATLVFVIDILGIDAE